MCGCGWEPPSLRKSGEGPEGADKPPQNIVSVYSLCSYIEDHMTPTRLFHSSTSENKCHTVCLKARPRSKLCRLHGQSTLKTSKKRNITTICHNLGSLRVLPKPKKPQKMCVLPMGLHGASGCPIAFVVGMTTLEACVCFRTHETCKCFPWACMGPVAVPLDVPAPLPE